MNIPKTAAMNERMMRMQATLNQSELTTRSDISAAHENCAHIPNDETLAALRESDEYLKQLKSGERKPRYSNIGEFMVALLSDESGV